MWQTMLDRLLSGMMVSDHLSVTYPDETTRSYGPDTGKHAHLLIKTPAALRALILNPDLGLGEGYMAGTLTPHA